MDPTEATIGRWTQSRGEKYRLPSQHVPPRWLELGIAERVACLFQASGNDAGAGQEQVVGHFPRPKRTANIELGRTLLSQKRLSSATRRVCRPCRVIVTTLCLFTVVARFKIAANSAGVTSILEDGKFCCEHRSPDAARPH